MPLFGLPDRRHDLRSRAHLERLLNGNVVKRWEGFNNSTGGPARVLPGGIVIAASGAGPVSGIDWIDRLLTTELDPVDVPADLLEARADYTSNLLERVDALQSAIDLIPNRGDLRLKLGATYVIKRDSNSRSTEQ